LSRVAFHTFGCRVNQYETESLKEQFIKNGYSVVSFSEEADVYVVNTCTVTSLADKKNRNMLRRPKKLNSKAIVVATGCHAQTNPKDLASIEEVDIVVGQAEKSRLFDLVNNFQNYELKGKSFVGNVFKYEQYQELDFSGLRELDKAFVKIQDGCDRFCSFCKIPFARGRKRSRPLNSIIEESKKLVAEGYKEIVLIGIHLGAYGEDLDENICLDDVIEALLNIDGLYRLRVSSIYPDTVSDRFIDLMQHPKMMPHLHVSIQSADDHILGLMRRRYDSKLMYDNFEKIQNRVDNISFTGDVIIGFPGEQDDHFMNTYNFVNSFNFSNLHIFPYSDRDKTEAKSFLNKVDSKIKFLRYSKLNELVKRLQNSFMSKYLNKKVEILAESSDNDFIKGYTKNFLRASVDIRAKPGNLVTFIPRRIDNAIFYGDSAEVLKI
jgi:threonylcarbamoyladenosine tRNA methylthiotransferase MtaB